jgi:hypothetical protein
VTWFRQMTGFDETSPEAVREMIQLSGSQLISLANSSSYKFGRLEIPTLGELRERIREAQTSTSRVTVREVVADVQNLHVDTLNTGALFQVASQFNLLEMVLSANEQQLDELRSLLRIGVQWDTQVTLRNSQHVVTQAYCSAMPVTYTEHSSSAWKPFARLVLEAAYEATLCVGILNARATGNRTVFLTLLGGGAFGNMTEWISDAIRHALTVHRHADLDVAIVSHGTSREFVRALAKEYAV